MGESVSPDELTARLLRDRVFFEESGGGVTLSGGECLATPARQRFAQAVLAACRREGVRTAVETTLAMPLVDPSALVQAVDLFLVDFKIANRARSIEVTGINVVVSGE